MRIFRKQFAIDLRDRIQIGNSLSEYYKTDFEFDDDFSQVSPIEAFGDQPKLDLGVEADLENAIKIYEYLPRLDKVQASDPRVWSYLSHVKFREYTVGRWPIPVSLIEAEKSKESKDKAIRNIVDHWFSRTTSRSLQRHSIARLWWNVHLSVAPWEMNEARYGMLKNEDRYIYTKILFSNRDVAASILERNFGFSDDIRFASLEHLRRFPQHVNNKDFGDIAKEINLALGYRNLALLKFEELVEFIGELSVDSLKN